MSDDQFTRTFKGDGSSFSATREAENYLGMLGFSVGTYCRNSPRAIVRGDVAISKWRNLSSDDIDSIDGQMPSVRDGSVTIRLKENPES